MAVPTYNWSHRDNQNPVVAVPGNVRDRTLGVTKVTSHTGEAQLETTLREIDECCEILNRSPLGKLTKADRNMFIRKVIGHMGDHAKDVIKKIKCLLEKKKLLAIQDRGEAALKAMNEMDRLKLVAEGVQQAMDNAEGGWETLSVEEQDLTIKGVYAELVIRSGEREWDQLTEEEQEDALFFVSMGCCCHKDLNVVKWAVKRMDAAYKKFSVQAPIPLPNKATARGAALAATARHGQGLKELEQAPSGAIRATILAGLLLNNKDDKVGYHDTYRDYFYKINGFACRFPETGKSRFGSHQDAAVELLVNLDVYIRFLDVIKLNKQDRSLTNLELNLYNALHDPPTLTELAVLALRSQAIGRPYLGYVRNIGYGAVHMGPFHERVKAHIKALIDNPDLLLGSEANSASGSLLGEPWDRPDIIYCILQMVPNLPNLKIVLVEFLQGELDAWDRFTTEWAPGSSIAKATEEQLAKVSLKATNDGAEGDLGQARVWTRDGYVDDDGRNARIMWGKNDVESFSQAVVHGNEQLENYVTATAREREQSGVARQQQLSNADHLKTTAAEHLLKDQERNRLQAEEISRLKGIDLEYNVEAFDDKKTWLNAKLDEQIDKWRSIQGKDVVPAKTTAKNRALKVQAITQAIERYRTAQESTAQTQDDVADDSMAEGESTAEIPLDYELQHAPSF
jgi:hypothetical protein